MLQVPRPEARPVHNAREFCVRIESKIKSQVKFWIAARRGSQEDSMKKLFLLIVVQVLLVTLGFGQTPAPNGNPQPASIKGCLGGADANYTVAEDGTTQTFRITSSTVDLKPHLGHDVELIGQTANIAPSSGPADNTVTVTGVNMISDHCATATASTPAAADPATPGTAGTPATDTTVAATPSAPAATDTTVAATTSTPAAADTQPTPPASTQSVADPTPAPAAAATMPAETASAPMAASANAPTSSAPTTSEQLPETATSLPLLGLLGLGLLATGLLIRRFRTN